MKRFLLGCLIGAISTTNWLHAEEPLQIISSTPLGLPCAGVITVGCMPDAQQGWLVLVKGDGIAFVGRLTYTDSTGKERTEMAMADYGALAFRVGRFWEQGNKFVSLEVTALKAAGTVRQDASGAVITVGQSTFGPPVQAKSEVTLRSGPPAGVSVCYDLRTGARFELGTGEVFIGGSFVCTSEPWPSKQQPVRVPAHLQGGITYPNYRAR